MDCETVRNLIERAALEATTAEENLRWRRHTAECSACAEFAELVSRWDHELSRVVTAVPIPERGPLQVLRALRALDEAAGASLAPVSRSLPESSIATSSTEIGATAVTSESVRYDRRWLLAGLASTAAGLTGLGIWYGWRAGRIDLVEVERELVERPWVSAELAPFERFDRSVSVDLPRTISPEPFSRLKPLRATVGGRTAALWIGGIPMRRREVTEVRMLAIPYHDLRNPPASVAFLQHTPRYRERFCLVSWHEGSLVYVCAVRGTDTELRRLLPQVSAT